MKIKDRLKCLLGLHNFSSTKTLYVINKDYQSCGKIFVNKCTVCGKEIVEKVYEGNDEIF